MSYLSMLKMLQKFLDPAPDADDFYNLNVIFLV